jgi:hypothetical protein
MNISSSFLKDRPPNEKETADLRFDIPKEVTVGGHEDVFYVSVIDPNSQEVNIETATGENLTGKSPENWYFRMN